MSVTGRCLNSSSRATMSARGTRSGGSDARRSHAWHTWASVWRVAWTAARRIAWAAVRRVAWATARRIRPRHTRTIRRPWVLRHGRRRHQSNKTCCNDHAFEHRFDSQHIAPSIDHSTASRNPPRRLLRRGIQYDKRDGKIQAGAAAGSVLIVCCWLVWRVFVQKFQCLCKCFPQ